MKEWVEHLTHEKITPEAKTVLDKFETPEDAYIGYVELQKNAGKPFKLPEALDKLPDDKTRSELTAQVGKLYGAVEKEEDLADVNFAEGLADARNVNHEFVAAAKKFAVTEKLPKSVVAKFTKLLNGFTQQALTTQQQTVATQAQKDLDETRKVLSPLFGGDEGIKQNQELVRRMFQNHAGLTAEEYEKSAKSILDNGIMRDAVFAKGLFNLAANFKEGQTEGAQQQTGAPKKETLSDRQDKALPIITGHLWPKKDK